MDAPTPLPDGLVRDLGHPAAHPADPSAPDGVARIQTHLSHVFLTGDRAVKIRKPVDLGFVDFSRLSDRNRDCLAEVSLNRRLAPDVYLGVAPIVRGESGWELGKLGEALRPGHEHAVVMRRLRPGTDALSLLGAGRLGPRRLEAAAAALARFHADHAVPAQAEAHAWRPEVDAPMQACIEALRGGPVARPEEATALASGWTRALDLRRSVFERRAQRRVDGHGDVRLEHLWFETADGPPLFIDCVEFDPELRRIDPASEVAFLVMDLAHRGRSDLGEHFLGCYAVESDDFDLYGVVDPFVAYRAAVRAKVAAIAAEDRALAPEQRASAHAAARSYLKLALRSLEVPGPGRVIALCGTVGTGKSTVARALARAIGGAVVVSTDRTRKRVVAAGRSEERYAPERIEAVYEAVLARAAPALASGRTVLLDATFQLRETRDRVRAWARAAGADAWLLHVDCPEAIARDRLRVRSERGGDASEAGPERLATSRAAFERPDEWPGDRRIELDTGDEADIEDEIRAAAERIGIRTR